MRAFRIKATKKPAAISLEGPNAFQRTHADYQEATIIHAETFTRAKVHRIRQQSSLRKLMDDGQLTEDQYWAAQEIAHVAEKLQRGLGARCASLEARVDCSGSGRDGLVEKLGYVRAEATYTRWRTSIAIPRRMIVDMVLEDRSLFATARTYGVGWPRAKRLLSNALDHWINLMAVTRHNLDEADLERAQIKAGLVCV